MTSLNKVGSNRAARFIMGKKVTVRIKGTYLVTGEDNKKHTVNCGTVYLENDSPDRAAFVVGVEETLAEYTGEIIAIIKNKETKKDAWVIAPCGMILYEPALSVLLAAFIDPAASSFVCLYEKSCGAVLYTCSIQGR